MNVYIIHLPHTFDYLLELSPAFKKYGFSRVTLVANGFDFEQIQRLNSYAENHDFVTVLDIPTKRILSHGQALNLAFEHCQEEYFCFADHDIFPTQIITDKIFEALKNHDVVSLGDRPENTHANYKGFAASAVETQSGVPLATSFFSVYQKAATQSVMRAYGVGFEQYFRKSQLPASLINHPDIEALNEPFLVDTCKALSLAMHEDHRTVTHLGATGVCHLGGLCGAISRYIQSGKPTQTTFHMAGVPSAKDLEQYYRDHQQRHPKVLEMKRMISDYALQLLLALKKSGDLPKFSCDDPSLNDTLYLIEQQVTAVFSSDN